RDLGVIETTPRTAGSVVEPWRTDNADVEEMLAHTVNFERRRARFEFVPEGFAAPVPDPQAPSVGPGIPGSDRAEQRFDLMKAGGRIELRAWVYVDRAFLPNQSFGRWTLGETRYSTDPTQARRPDDPGTNSNRARRRSKFTVWASISSTPALSVRQGSTTDPAVRGVVSMTPRSRSATTGSRPSSRALSMAASNTRS
ncbi:MAG: hypothetical protein ACKORL_07900, partial [Phycisphaerales bacterium]